MKTEITKEDGDRANERMRELVAEGFSPAVALGLAWEETTGRRANPDGALIVTLLQAPGEEGLASPSFQEVPAQLVDATQALNLSAGVSNCKVSRGRSFS